MKNHFSNLAPLNSVRENVNSPLLNELDENLSSNARPLTILSDLKQFEKKQEFIKKASEKKFRDYFELSSSDKTNFLMLN